MKSKSLDNEMTHAEMIAYILKHPEYHQPSTVEAEQINDNEHNHFWVSEDLDGRLIYYDKKRKAYKITHPNTRQPVVLVKREL